MNGLALTFALLCIPASLILAWLFTPWGKRWLKQ